MLKAVIVDDEPLARDELGYLLRRTGRVQVVGVADRLEQAVEQIRSSCPDVVFLDIQLDHESGLEIARGLMTKNEEHLPVIVFATAYDEYALQAFDLNAADYILKPFEEERVRQMVEKITAMAGIRRQPADADLVDAARYAERKERLAITVDERILLLPVGQILYMAYEDGKTIITTENQVYRVNEPLTSLERRVGNTAIVRVHRAYLVNLDSITEIEPWFHSTCNLILINGSRVPVSRTYMKELKQLLGF
ncbi:LytR/AlgR family response regulator transcription factor [Paenibacillus jiagnxiensis]|uniref:LytR/AlgR family response regulator transcription factor n=1 Tax=Paenibacillus jiagnxiensis TaxID=3228926 RepID=UPI0033B8A262